MGICGLAWFLNTNKENVQIVKEFNDENFPVNSCVKISNSYNDLIYFKEYKGHIAGHPDGIQRNLTPKEFSIHKKYNSYKVISKSKGFYLLSNTDVPSITLKLSPSLIKASSMDCPNLNKNKMTTFGVNTCIEYSNVLSGVTHFWKILNETESAYELEGIYSSYYLNLVLKEGMSSEIFKHYNPELNYPMMLNKLVVNKFSKVVQCPQELSAKFSPNDCLVYGGNKYLVIDVHNDTGVYEAKKINVESKQDRKVASTESLEELSSGLQKAKAVFGLKDFFFFDNDKLEPVNCE